MEFHLPKLRCRLQHQLTAGFGFCNQDIKCTALGVMQKGCKWAGTELSASVSG